MSEYGEDNISNEVARVARILGFAARAVLRHWQIALAVFVVTVTLAVVGLVVMDRTYRVETRVLTNKNYIIPNLVSPSRPIPGAADAPTRGVAELMTARDSISRIVDDADLMSSWDENRGTIGRIKDTLRNAILGPMTNEDKKAALVEVLATKLGVYLDGDVVVTRVEWHHPATTMRIAQAAQQRFLEMKRDLELSEVRETLGILQSKVDKANDEAEAAKEALAGMNTAADARMPMKTVRVKREGPPADPNKLAALESARDELSDVQAAIGTYDKEHQRRLAEAQTVLRSLRQSLGPNHPDIQNAIRVVEERSVAPAGLSQSKQRENELKAQINRAKEELGMGGGGRFDTVEVPDVDAARRGQRVDPAMEAQLRDMQNRIYRLNEARQQLDLAETELITANAAFDYRYVVTLPPVLPKKHVKPKVPVMLGGGLFVALFLAFFFAVAADLRTRRVIEPWQAEVVDIPVLGVVHVPRDKANTPSSQRKRSG